MNIHRGWINHPSTMDEQARTWARHLEDREVERIGEKLTTAREILARRIGVPKGTLENLRRDRIKGVKAWIFERLRSAYVAERERQLRQLTHEIAIAKALAGSDHAAVRAAEAVAGHVAIEAEA